MANAINSLQGLAHSSKHSKWDMQQFFTAVQVLAWPLSLQTLCPVTNLSVACTSFDTPDIWYLTRNGPCCVVVHRVQQYHICKYSHSQHLALKAYAATQECALYVVLSIWTPHLSSAALQCSTSLTHLACLDKLSGIIA